MGRITTTPFVLNLPTGAKKSFAVGDKVEAEHAEHWYAIAHSRESESEPNKLAEDKPAEEAAPATESEPNKLGRKTKAA